MRFMSEIVLNKDVLMQRLEEIVNREIKEVLNVYGPLLLKLIEKCEPIRCEYWSKVISSLREEGTPLFERLKQAALIKRKVLDLIGEPCVEGV